MHPLWQFDSNIHAELASCLKGVKRDFYSSSLSQGKREKIPAVIRRHYMYWGRFINVMILFTHYLGTCVRKDRQGVLGDAIFDWSLRHLGTSPVLSVDLVGGSP